MNNIKKLVSVLFSAILLFSATITSSIAIEKIHFVIGGGAGGGWDGTARGTGAVSYTHLTLPTIAKV